MLTEEQREAIRQALAGDWQLANHLELSYLQAQARRKEFAPHPANPADPYWEDEDFSDYVLSDASLPETGHMNELYWTRQGADIPCDFCDGTGSYTVHGNRNSVDIDCPDCNGDGYHESESIQEILTDLDGVIITDN